MELRQLRYFVALAEELSFTRAARKMHVTQSTLSHQIRSLEEEVGQPLFERLASGIVITDAGETLLPSATRALREVDEGLRVMKAAPDPLVGSLRVGATHTFIVKLIPECLASFVGQHPAVAVVVREMFASEVVRLVAAGELDLGITYEPERRDDLHFEALYVEEMVLAVGAGHPLASRKRVRGIELHRMRMVLPSRNSSTRRLLEEGLRAVGAEPIVVAEMDALAASIELVRRSDLATIVSRLAAHDATGVSIVPLENPTPTRKPGLLTRTDAAPTAVLRSFSAILRRTVRQHSR